MKTLALIVRSLVVTLATTAAVTAFCSPASSQTDEVSISQKLATTGQIMVANVGDYIHSGSYRIWVSSHLGRPDRVLPDGSWIYDNLRIENSAVEGSVEVSFRNGRVLTLRLLSPASVAALLRPSNTTGQMVALR